MRLTFVLGLLVLLSCSSNDAPAARVGSASFAGVAWVAPDREGKLLLSWAAATDPNADASRLRYRVYASTIAHKSTSFPAQLTTLAGLTSVAVEARPLNARHYVTVRVVDEAGLEDANTVERSAVAFPDSNPPVFGGLTTISNAPNAGATLSWDPAIDDGSPAEAITYEVFGGSSAGGVDFGKVLGTTAPGVTTITLSRQGMPGEQRLFAVRARDAAGNGDANTKAVAGTLGPDGQPPVFGGCGSVTATGPTSLVASWGAATDDYTPADKLAYDVFVTPAVTPSGPAASVVGKLEVVVKGLTAGATYSVTCHARDAANNSDTNSTSRSITMNSDATPPVFAGLTTTTAFDPIFRSVTLNWLAATDNVTQPSALVYDVYESVTPGTEHFGAAPKATSAPGATSITLNDLAANTALYWVVRARDQAGNVDGNAIERTQTTNVSFSLNVLPTLVSDCAVVGCHVSGIATGGLVMSPAFAHGNLVNVPAGEKNAAWNYRVEPSSPTTSYLYRKVAPASENLTFVGNRMPAPATGNTLSAAETALMKQWITDGAPNN